MNSTDYDNRAVRAARRALDLSQEEVAERLDVHAETISRAERGVNCSYSLLRRLAALYGASLQSWLHDVSTEPRKNTSFLSEKATLCVDKST